MLLFKMLSLKQLSSESNFSAQNPFDLLSFFTGYHLQFAPFIKVSFHFLTLKKIYKTIWFFIFITLSNFMRTVVFHMFPFIFQTSSCSSN